MPVEDVLRSPKMFGAYVENISASIGWNGQGGSCQMTLVEDPDNGVEIDLPPVGTACYFKYHEFYYGGVFQRWTYKEDIGGRKYDVILESPGGKVLNGVNVILSNFEGTAFNEGEGYDKLTPSSSNPNITTQVKNVWNALGHKENYTFGGRFGAANINSAGYPARDLLDLLELFSRGESDFGGPIRYGQSQYLFEAGNLKEVPEFFRISGQSQNLNAILQECADLLQYDYFATVEPAGGMPTGDGGGTISNPVVKIITIDKTQQPDPGKIREIVLQAKDDGSLVSSDVGQELSDEVTQRIVVGGPASRYFVANINDCIPVWGKVGPKRYVLAPGFARTPQAYRPNAKVPVVLDEMSGLNGAIANGIVSTSYTATVMELRMAMAGIDSWLTFKSFEAIANGTYYSQDSPWVSYLDVDIETLIDVAQGRTGAMSLASTSLISGRKMYSPVSKEQISFIFGKVEATAKTFYGRMFLVPLPVEPGGISNNLKFVEEDILEVPSWDLTDTAWVSNKPISDVAFYNGDGRLKSTAVYELNSRYDYSDMKSDYAAWSTFGASQAFADGIATTQSGPHENNVFFIDGFDTPFAVIDTGTVVTNWDDMTTPDFGLSVLASYFFNVTIPPEAYITAGKSSTQISVPPGAAYPKFLGIPQESSRYAWGPWYKSTSEDGRSEVVFDSNLRPETFGSVDRMNQAGQDTADAGASEISANESGRIELARFPEFNIADRFAGSGPYVTDMSISIATGGLTTEYKFNTWTPNFGKLTKYNSDRISRIYKASLAALQRIRQDSPKRGFEPIPFQKSSMEQIVKRLSPSRSSGGFSFFSLFNPPQGDTIPLSDAAGIFSNEQKANQSFGCSADQQWSPAGTRAIKRNNDIGQYLQLPLEARLQGEQNGKFTVGVCPSSRDLDPYFSEAIVENAANMIRNVDFLAACNATNGQTTDLNLYKANNNAVVDEVRSLALRGPLMLSSWGFDIAYNPVPHTQGDITEFNTSIINGRAAALNRAYWKTGPVNLMWDEERKIWSGGPEILSGVLEEDITAPESPTQPTSFKVKIMRRTGQSHNNASMSLGDEIVTCVNRDPSLSQAADGGNVFAMIIRINYEWLPLWVGCP